MPRYAERTKVPVNQTVQDIRKMVTKYEGHSFQFGMDDEKVIIGFAKDKRHVRFKVSLVDLNDQEQRSALRSLLLVTKAKLEAVASGISIFEDEFMANIVMPDGSVLGSLIRDRIANAYASGIMPNLLPDFT